ncbi:MAG TPA: acyl-CoA dehydrogenase family protein [Sphingopyxis sp.]|uniref:acyl-CoA dehydrogenase family protein n=1 Tax=Sphingopyxis sp. TaxID=1908224 RepID=UPI002B891063|nr:acyl-CoA dehydrogenase family protein [Sphingopyxis sp.]HWW56964.1 acyl-CoA dehydrogenase family protein [Sphingopyxis sp.]
MTILYDESQQAIATESRRVLEARVSKDALLPLLETVGEYHRPFWDTAKEQGWTALALPETHGGLDLGLVELGLIAHEAGRSISGAPFLTSSFGAAKAVELFGSETQKARWLPGLASGETIGAIAFSEGPDALPRRPDVTLTDDRLDGTARGISAGLAADMAIVLANRAGTPVLAIADLAGVERSPVPSFDNSRCLADLHFSATTAETLAAGDTARDAALHILALQAVVTAHEQTGGAEALMEIARDYALTRRAFGQPIGAFQSVKHRITELYGLVELARANCIHAAAREGMADFITAAAAARLSATEAYDSAARDCIQVHGGIGVTWEIGLHLHMRRARSLAIEQGSSLFWEDILVDRLAGEAA